MIARVWSARIRPSDVATYVEHFEHSVRPHLTSIDGFIEAAVMVRAQENSAAQEVVVESRWRSMDAIATFAGRDPSVAVVDPAAEPLFVDYDRAVRHYTIVSARADRASTTGT